MSRYHEGNMAGECASGHAEDVYGGWLMTFGSKPGLAGSTGALDKRPSFWFRCKIDKVAAGKSSNRAKRSAMSIVSHGYPIMRDPTNSEGEAKRR